MPGTVLIDGRIIGYRRGGIANYARQLAELIPGVAGDLDVRVATCQNVPELSDRAVRAFTPPHHRFERFAFGAEAMLRGAKLIHSPDYIHPHAPGVGKVITVHDLAFISRPELVTSDSLSYYGQVRETVHSADHVIAVSESTKRQLIELLNAPGDRISVIPNGIDHGVFHPDASGDRALLSRLHPRLLHELGSGRPVILAVGTIEPRKRIDILIQAFKQLARCPNIHRSSQPILVVAGESGWLVDPVIAELRRLQRENSAIWIRDLDDNELAALYRASSLLVMPSVDEGFGLPVLEAMACGTPALTSTTGALPDLVGDRGFHEVSENPARWAEKITAILADSEMRNRRAQRGIEKASEYSWRATAEATAKVYREVIKQR